MTKYLIRQSKVHGFTFPLGVLPLKSGSLANCGEYTDPNFIGDMNGVTDCGWGLGLAFAVKLDRGIISGSSVDNTSSSGME